MAAALRGDSERGRNTDSLRDMAEFIYTMTKARKAVGGKASIARRKRLAAWP